MLDRLKPPTQNRGNVFADNFRTAIENVIRDQFAGHDISEVRLGWSVDFDGDDSLIVDIVIEDDISSYSGSSLSGLTRRLRDVLRENSLVAFPLVSFSSASEVDEVAA